MSTSINSVVKGIKMIRPPRADASPEILQRWRWIISGTLLVTALAVSLAFTVGSGLVPGFPGVAFAEDIEHPVSAEAFSLVVESVAALETKADASDKYLKRLVARDIRADIFEKLAAYCAADSAARRTLRQELDDLQDEHKEATGDAYPEKRCEDI